MRRITTIALVLGFITGCGLSAYTGNTTQVSEQISDSQEKGVLKVNLSVDIDEFEQGDAIPVRLILHNTGNSPAPFLLVNTAFEEALSADVFDVVLDGESQPYLGIVARRLPPTIEDVLIIGPDETLERNINIAEYYKMDHTGEYHVRYAPQELFVGEELDFEFKSVTVETDQATVTVR